MQKKLIFIVVILLQITGFQIQAQQTNFGYSKSDLISPENVSIHYEEQAEYYIQKYEPYLAEIEKIKTEIVQVRTEEVEMEVEIKTQIEKDVEDIKAVIESRKRKNKKTKLWEKMLCAAEEELQREKQIKEEIQREKQKQKEKQKEIQEEIQRQRKSEKERKRELIKEYIKLWADYEINESKDLSDLSSENTCYEINGENRTYAPGEYKVLEINPNEKIQWEEIKPPKAETVTSTYMVEAPSSVKKQVKKPDCESPTPDDCLEWKVVEIPGRTATKTERVSLKECKDQGFVYQDTYDRCVKTITANSTKKYIKVIDIQTGMEIQVIDYKVVKCE